LKLVRIVSPQPKVSKHSSSSPDVLGQSAWIVPSHGLVIVRIGKYRGAQQADDALERGMKTLMSAVKPL
jgi:hypothetical protein